MRGWELRDMCPILHTFSCQSDEATLQCSSLQCRLQGMHLYLSGYGKNISILLKTDFWYIIELCCASFLRWDKAFTSITLICNNSKLFQISVPILLTFIGGDAHIDSCIILRKAFGWTISSCVASEGIGPQSKVNSELSSGSCFLICRYCRCSLAPVASLQHFVCGLSSILFDVC